MTGNFSQQPFKVALGGPALGYFWDIKKFLGGLVKASNPKARSCSLLETENGVVLQSAYEDIGQVELFQSDLDEHQRQIVFCHNDLEPRNILVTEASPERYELAGVIDWEMAIFFPFAYEHGYKDTDLGYSNLFISWYTMFKNQTAHLLPQAEGYEKLIKALQIIDKSDRSCEQKHRQEGWGKVDSEGTSGGIYQLQ